MIDSSNRSARSAGRSAEPTASRSGVVVHAVQEAPIGPSLHYGSASRSETAVQTAVQTVQTSESTRSRVHQGPSDGGPPAHRFEPAEGASAQARVGVQAALSRWAERAARPNRRRPGPQRHRESTPLDDEPDGTTDKPTGTPEVIEPARG